MMAEQDPEFSSLRYIIVRPFEDGERLVVSASPDYCPRYPPDRFLAWVKGSASEAGLHWGFSASQTAGPSRWATHSFESSFGWQSVFFELKDALGVHKDQLGEANEAWVLGLAVPGVRLPDVLAALSPPSQSAGCAPVGVSGHMTVGQLNQPLAEGGSVLGYEAVQFAFALLHESAEPLNVSATHASDLRQQFNDVDTTCSRLNTADGFWCPVQLVRFI